MTEDIPVWRRAIQEQDHPLHRIAWVLFEPERIFHAKFIDRILPEKRADVVAFCYLLLDTDDLYEENALGGGYAPVHAARLLGHWRVEAAIPRLLHIVRHEEPGIPVFDAALLALEEIGVAATAPLLDLLHQLDPHEDDALIPLYAAGTLAQIGRGNPDVWDFLKQQMYRPMDEEYDYELMVGNCLDYDAALGREFIESCLRDQRLRQHHRVIREALAAYESR